MPVDQNAKTDQKVKTDQIVKTETHPHQHRDVAGGWLRPAVFGAMDGLVTNVSLIAGVGGGGGSVRAITLSGLAGLAAGACSMAAGEFVSVASQNELVDAEVRSERAELENHPDEERRELEATFRARGVDADLAARVVEQISAHPEHALAVHVREELGVNPHALPSPLAAAMASFVAFAVGAMIPLLPYLVGLPVLGVSLGASAIAAVIGGGIVSRLTNRPVWYGALRQLALGAAAAAVTFGIGHLVGIVAS
jgi:vacuolar iron transporter family protein